MPSLVVWKPLLPRQICDDNNGHQHTYSDEWSVDGTNHWHAATCSEADDCATSKTVVAAHADENKDKICDVCGYDYDHSHTYATELTKDENNHWYAVTCGCSVEVKGKAAHVDADNNGVCDTCAFVACEHTYITDAWAMNAEKHWHAASCSHAVVADEEEHDFDEMGLCAVCGYLEGETITVEKAVDLGEFYAGLVKGGNIVKTYSADAYMPVRADLIEYELGKNNSYYNLSTGDGDREEFYLLTEDNALFAVQKGLKIEWDEDWNEVEVIKETPIFDPNSAMIDGYVFSEIFGSDTEDAFEGVEGLIAGLYELGKDTADFTEAVIAYEDQTLYVFSFNSEVFVGYNWQTDETYDYCYKVEVAFTLSDNYSIENASVTSGAYLCVSDEVEAVDEGEDAPAITYSIATTIPVSLREWVITQTEGERDLEPAYDPAKVLMSDFKLVDADGNEVGADGTITLEAGKTLLLSLVPAAPEAAILGIDTVVLTAEKLSTSYWEGDITLSAEFVGEETLTITSLNAEKTYDVVSTVPAVQEIHPEINGMITYEYNMYADADGMTEVTFGASVNAYANGAFTATLAPASMMSCMLTDNGDGTYTVTMYSDFAGNASALIMIASVENPEITATLTINATPAPAIEDILSGTYAATIMDWNFNQHGDTNLTVVLTPASEGALNGTMLATISYEDWWSSYTYTETLSYEYADGVLTTTSIESDYTNHNGVSGFGYTYSISENYELQISWMQGTATLTPATGSGSGDDSGDGTVSFANTAWESDVQTEGMMAAYVLDFYGSWMSDYLVGAYPDFTYTVEGDVINFTFLNPYEGALAGATFNYDADNNQIVATLVDGSVVIFNQVA